ncbi:GTP-binding protein [Marinomonas sp. PE14-40]|uniref:GTP-binding protein n=1 Tax=Marinomonas sp. PE14-40 TaxID=3060621 RepID=UPI003F666D05
MKNTKLKTLTNTLTSALTLSALTLVSHSFASHASASQSITSTKLKPVWEVSGFKMPESVVYDSQRQQYYVANINDNPMSADGNGSIGLIKQDGKSSVIEWVKGLSSPKGLEVKGNKLYVADVHELVVINLDDANIIARYPAPKAKVLNGIAISDSGQVFVSDWAGNALYQLQDGELINWLDSAKLESPNGLFVNQDYLYIAAWGADIQADFSTLTSGNLKRVAITKGSQVPQTSKVESLGDKASWQNLDGLHAYQESNWLTTDFLKGQLLNMNSQGDIESIYKLEPGSADFYYREDKDLVIVPYFMSNKVVAYTLDK